MDTDEALKNGLVRIEPLILEGRSALSRFRINSLLARMAADAPHLRISSIEAQFVYFVEPGAELSARDLERCLALLGAHQVSGGPDGFYVTPRKGTISPWSSKATDIFHNCGIDNVLRVERGIRYRIFAGPGGGRVSGGRRRSGAPLPMKNAEPLLHAVHDRMTEGVYTDLADIFVQIDPRPFATIDVQGGGRAALENANAEKGLALSKDDIDYLHAAYKAMRRNPTDVELTMFGQVNSEHCRHKIFNADWIIDGVHGDLSLFGMIRNTHKTHPAGTLMAYADNAAIIEGFREDWFESRRGGSPTYRYGAERVDIVMKVETHNHPTAISPFPGAATGVGGEIRDEAATGIGGRSKAGLCGFMVSNLRIPGFEMPWEKDYAEFPGRLATPLEIMIDGPLGGAAFGNEFGRPQLCGFFRTYEEAYNGRYRGYHKPIMVAGGVGAIKRMHSRKKDIPRGACIIQLGGPAMRIGLGGGAASSMATGSNVEALDFDSVQRENAEMQRRCQEVIEACIAMEERNPILSIHDLGAGGLSNGCPELVSETGGRFWLRKVHNEERSMSPMEIWCCEAQERYVLAIPRKALDTFVGLCERERCPVAVIGEATGDGRLVLHDEHFGNNPIDIELKVILGKPPKMLRDVKHQQEQHPALDLGGVTVGEAAERVLRLPCVANKTFLITITDRTVQGMTARDQMVGPFQVPISDVAVTAVSYHGYAGAAMAMGERAPVALVNAPASGRMAIAEALTNICASDIGGIGNVKLSANWMCACGEDGEDARLFDTVRAVGMEFCPAIGVSIPVGKDSLSMRTVWETSAGGREKMIAPLSLVASSFAPVRDVRKTVTPDLKRVPATSLVLIDLGRGRNRLGCSALAQVYNQVGAECADAESPADLVAFFEAMQELVDKRLLLAYHDRSDGGLFVTLAEMAFGGRTGLTVKVDGLGGDALSILFSEELGGVIQVENRRLAAVMKILALHGMGGCSHVIGKPSRDGRLTVKLGSGKVFSDTVTRLNRMWAELTCRMQERRDNPACAKEEYDNILDRRDRGMDIRLSFKAGKSRPSIGRRPKVAILREQGVNGHVEMAAAFDAAGFESVDVHMTDLLSGRTGLAGFTGLAACGGFSYGDVLGAGSGWAKSILFNERLKEMFAGFFGREDTFTLGVCNGCQMVAQLKEIIPGAGHWPEFTRNKSERFEARYVTVEVLPSPSVLLKGMAGSRIGIPVAHGEGYADFTRTGLAGGVARNRLAALRYVNNRGQATERYPFNPNGSTGGLTGLTTLDGRVTIMMPHPERAFRALQLSYRPGWMTTEEGPWLKLFQNARTFVRGV
ncbi:MAG: phosphoribosylformylglycinamidine synthase [bacterium]